MTNLHDFSPTLASRLQQPTHPTSFHFVGFWHPWTGKDHCLLPPISSTFFANNQDLALHRARFTSFIPSCVPPTTPHNPRLAILPHPSTLHDIHLTSVHNNNLHPPSTLQALAFTLLSSLSSVICQHCFDTSPRLASRSSMVSTHNNILRSQVSGPKSQVSSLRSQVSGLRSQVSGLRSSVFGLLILPQCTPHFLLPVFVSPL